MRTNKNPFTAGYIGSIEMSLHLTHILSGLLPLETEKMRLNKTRLINGAAVVLCFYIGFWSNRLPPFTTVDKHLKVLILVPKEEMGGPAGWANLNYFSLRMAHRHYYGLSELEDKLQFPVKIKFYVEGKLNKWLSDEDYAWRDMSFHSKKARMDKIIEKEMTSNAFGVLISDLEHVINFDGHFLEHGNMPLSKGTIKKLKSVQDKMIIPHYSVQ